MAVPDMSAVTKAVFSRCSLPGAEMDPEHENRESARLQNCGTCVYKAPFIRRRVGSSTQHRCVLVAVKHVSSLPLRSFCRRGPLSSVLRDSAASVTRKRVQGHEALGVAGVSSA